MATPRSFKGLLFRTTVILLVLVSFVTGCIVYDGITVSRLRPPDDLQTLDDFLAWRPDGFVGRGKLEFGGDTYTVILSRRRRFLAFGSPVYLFDTNRQFFDWTSDMGDAYTDKRRLNLSSAHIRDFHPVEP